MTPKRSRRRHGEAPGAVRVNINGYVRPPYRFNLELGEDRGAWLEQEIARRNDELPEDYLDKGKKLLTKRHFFEMLLDKERKRVERMLKT